MQFYKLHMESYKMQTHAPLAHKLLTLVTSDWFVKSAIFLYRRLIGPIVLRLVSQPIIAHFLSHLLSHQNEEERLTSVFLL